MNDALIERLHRLAAETGLRYMLIDAGWYVGVTSSWRWIRCDPFDLPALVDYAGAGATSACSSGFTGRRSMHKWTRRWHLYQHLGLKGIKVDFMDRNDQEMVAFYHRLLVKAARHRLLVDLHGAYPPTGLSRTYPNLLTQEGVLGAEYNKWGARVTATHNVTLPFTRMLLGPMDYTPGGFRHVAHATCRPERTTTGADHARPRSGHVRGVDSPLVSLADTPDAYRGQARHGRFARRSHELGRNARPRGRHR